MKEGLFPMFTRFALVCLLAQLSGCASLLVFEEDNQADYDRGYQTAEGYDRKPACADEFCHTESDAARGLSGDEREARRQAVSRDVVIGMTRSDVMSSWGEPVQREVAGNGSTGHERWTYGSRYSLQGARTVIFENGRVAGWNR